MLNKQIAVAYRSFLNASSTLQAAIKPLLRGDHLPKAVVLDFAIEHASFYQAHYVVRDSGSVRFFLTSEAVSSNLHHAAQKAWDRGISKFVKTTTKQGGARNKTEVSVAEKFMATFHKLDAADRRAVIRLLKSEGLV